MNKAMAILSSFLVLFAAILGETKGKVSSCMNQKKIVLSQMDILI